MIDVYFKGPMINVLVEEINHVSICKTIRIYTHSLQPNIGLKSSIVLTSVEVLYRCFFTCRPKAILLHILNGMKLETADYHELYCYTLLPKTPIILFQG